jgi:uncharacterized protein
MNPEHLQLLVSREMPFGKYKGRLIADLPGHYLGWFAREGFPKGELGMLLALMHELDHNALRDLLEPLRSRRHSLQIMGDRSIAAKPNKMVGAACDTPRGPGERRARPEENLHDDE